jgi:SNF2 family DNA or RNA helicase
VGACLADDMGLGKTVQALAAILLSAAKGPTLVVAPLSVLGNWMDECTRFAPTLVPRQFGQGDRGAFLDSLGPFDLVISSYGLLQSENEKLAAVSWQTVVLDEAQAIKNMNTKRSKAAMTLSARFRLVTTGTPVENHLSELWTLFRFLNPGLLGTWTHFREAYVLPVERDQDKEASHRLKKLIRPFILRRIKSDVLSDLPDKTEVDLDVVMSDEEAMLYEAQRQVSIAAIERAGEEGAGQKRIRVLAELTRLRQLCCHPSLILPDMPLTGSKLKVFGDLVRELLDSHHKALVFSQFVRHLTVLRTYLDGQGISYRYLDGSTPAAERRRQVDAFQNGEGDLFLISLKAGGFGLNLTAADYVIHMDPWWNPAVEDQASDRAHRIGQTRPVTVYRLIMKNTIEEKIIRLHKDKRDLAESILSGTDVSAAVSTDELLDLLKGKG